MAHLGYDGDQVDAPLVLLRDHLAVQSLVALNVHALVMRHPVFGYMEEACVRAHTVTAEGTLIATPMRND